MKQLRRHSASRAAIAAVLCAAAGALGTGNLLALLPAALLARFVYAQVEAAMTTAVVGMAVLAAVTTPPFALGPVVAMVGTFVAAEIACAAGRVRRAGSLVVEPYAMATLRRHAALGAPALVAGAIVTIGTLPTWVAAGGAIGLVLFVATVVARGAPEASRL